MKKIIILFLFFASQINFGQNTFPTNGSVGIGTVNPTAKFEISGGAFKVGNEESRNFSVSFLNSAANQAIDIRFGNTFINGFIEIEITSTYSYQNSVGLVKKIYSVGANPNGAIWNTTTSRVVEAEGEIANNFTIGDFSWDGTNSTYKISIFHIVSTGNPLYVSVRYFSSGSVQYPLLESTSISSAYTTSIPSNYLTPQSVYHNGKVGIGTTNPDSKLTVKGKIHAEEVKIDLAVPADYVFEKYYLGKSELKPDYTMLSLSEIEEFTRINHHLPNVPSAKEIKENGLQLGEISNVLLQKIEEMTIYVIEIKKENEEMKRQNELLQKENDLMQKENNLMKKNQIELEKRVFRIENK